MEMGKKLLSNPRTIVLIALLTALIMGAAVPLPAKEPATSAPQAPSLQQEMLLRCIENLSRAQLFLELYALNNEFQYPENFEKLEFWLNEQYSKKAEKTFSVPLDPVTQKPFLYAASVDGYRYTLAVPSSEKYGLPDLKVSNFSWLPKERLEALKEEAEKWKAEKPLRDCEGNLKKIQNALEMYYVDNQGLYPVTLDKLVPKYLPKEPACPLTGASYLYLKKANGKQFEASCPNAKEHGLEELRITSSGSLIEK